MVEASRTNKDFICKDCVWGKSGSEYQVYCSKVGFECNGLQMYPVHFCDDFELKGIGTTESA
jgi:hypothetical protein